jgi:hypothetical protein
MNQPQSMMPKSNNGALKWLLVLLLLLILAGGGYYFWTTTQGSNEETSTATPTPTAKVSATPTAMASIPADWKAHVNTPGGYAIKYPSDWTTSASQDINKINFIKAAPSSASSEYVVSVLVVSSTKTPNDYMLELKDAPLATKQFSSYGSPSAVTIDGVDGAKFTDVTNVTNSGKWDWYLVSRNGKMYNIQIMKVQGEGTPYDLSTLISEAQMMIWTFRFTN